MSDPKQYVARDFSVHPRMIAPDYRSSRLRGPQQKPLVIPDVETMGPVFGHDILGAHDNDLIVNFAAPGQSAIGPRIIVHGRVLDTDARPITGALIEIWQANSGGRYRHKKDGYLASLDPNFGGCGRCISGDDGSYSFRTIQPGPYPWPNGGNDWRPAHIHLSVFGAGLPQRLITQLYFEGDPHIALCPIAQAIADKSAIDRLTARLDMAATVPTDIRAYRFDIVLRGARASVFENKPEGA
jgi:protocatechuate 3,4-dioxygenase beta subunit